MYKRLKYIPAVLPLLMGLASCAGDEPSVPSGNETTPTPKPVESPWVTIGGTGYSAIQWEASTESRASMPIAADEPSEMGTWCYNDMMGLSYSGAGEVFNNVKMFNLNNNRDGAIAAGVKFGNDGKWIDDNAAVIDTDSPWVYANPQPWLASTDERPVNYKFFAYSPYTTAIRAEEQSYAALNRIVFTEVDRYSNIDYLVANTIEERVSSKTGANPTVQMQMRHLESRLRFRFKLGERYDSLRILRIKKLEVRDLMNQKFTVVLTFNRDPLTQKYVCTELWNRNPVWSDYGDIPLRFDAPSDGTEGEDPYIELNHTEYKPVGSLYAYAGDGLQHVTIKVTYDIYDEKMQLLRENDYAVSKIEVALTPSGSSGGRSLEQGCYRNINILVQPKFLYVLSDNDMGAEGSLIVSP